MKRVTVEDYDLQDGVYYCTVSIVGNPKRKYTQRASWAKVMAYRSGHTEFDRPALIEDIEDVLNEGRVLGEFPGKPNIVSDFGGVFQLFNRPKTA